MPHHIFPSFTGIPNEPLYFFDEKRSLMVKYIRDRFNKSHANEVFNMRKEVVLITGANGEIGHGLIEFLHKKAELEIIAMDMQPLDERLESLCKCSLQGNILDDTLIQKILEDYDVRVIYHLAALLSSRGEQDPELSHHVNVDGTIKLLKMAVQQSERQGRPIKFIYPSSIAVYGISSFEKKQQLGKVLEDQYLEPITMYGCNKLYCESLGRYYMRHYKLLTWQPGQLFVDFRALRFPGLISAETLPTGGTTDYGPEMIHYAAQNKPYSCFVKAETRLPFMVMPDAIKSLIELEAAPHEALSQVVYNVSSFSPTAQDFAKKVGKAFPNANIEFKVNPKRQMIVDSWPGDIDDSKAREDWGWAPDYSQERAFNEYLLPTIKARYQEK
jgi:threonine 3-dehydrogenase